MTHAARTDDVDYAILRLLHCLGNWAHTQFTGLRIARVYCARASLSAFTFAQLLRSSPSRRLLRSYCIYFVVLSSNFSPHVSLKSKRSTAELQMSYRHSLLIGRQFIIAPSERCQIDQISSSTTWIIAMNNNPVIIGMWLRGLPQWQLRYTRTGTSTRVRPAISKLMHRHAVKFSSNGL